LSAIDYTDVDRTPLKRAAATAAANLVEDGMIVGLGTGSTATFAIEALADRYRNGLRFIGIPTSSGSADQAKAANIPLTTFSEHQQIDLTIDGADEVEKGTLNLSKGLGGALLHEKIVAAASRRLIIVIDETKLVNRLGQNTTVSVEVVSFGLEATQLALEELGATVRLRELASGEAFMTDSANHIFDCDFGPIDAPASLELCIRRIVGVVDSGIFINRADEVYMGTELGLQRLYSPCINRLAPPILVLLGVSGVGKSTVAKKLAMRLGWSFQEGDALHPVSNIAKMQACIPLSDNDRHPWLDRVVSWIDAQRVRQQPGIITCSALKRSYRQMITGNRPEVRLIYLFAKQDLILERLVNRSAHFMPVSLLQSQIDSLDAPGSDEALLSIEASASVNKIVNEIIMQFGLTES